ncbi:MAG: hypothetical protein IJT32_00520 [Lachnospiraceae bacterium]|nr:hypothetical protein [Lachnospiraceae bacterium]
MLDMSLSEILELTWIPILAFAMSFCAGVHMLIIKKRPPYLKTRGDNRTMRNEKKFAEVGGKLLIFFAMGAAAMLGLLFVNPWAALAEIIVVFLVFSWQWRNMNEKYGPIGYK